MLFTKSVGAVVFYRSPEGQIEYLLLNHGKEQENSVVYWNFPKGTMEKGETEMQTAERETEEETGLTDLNFFAGFRRSGRYFFRERRLNNAGKLIFKMVVFYLAQAENKDVKISSEHIGYEWLPLEEALARVKRFKSSRRILIRANKFLHEHPVKKTKY